MHGDLATATGAILIATTSGPLDYVEASDSDAPRVHGINVNALPWKATTDVVGGYRYNGPMSKVLHEDAETGASTTMVRVPAGYGVPPPPTSG